MTHEARIRNKGVALLSGLDLQLGGHLSEVKVTYEQWGDQTLDDDRTIVIFPSFSHSSHAASNRDDPRPGWWENMIGPGKAINTSAFRVICPSVLGSPYGSTSPLTDDPTTGKPFRGTFPQITPADMANKFARIFDPNCYLVLSKAMDLTNVGHGFSNLAEGVGRIKSDTLVIGVNQDLLVPPTEQATIANILESFDVPVTLKLLNSKYGHDAMFHPQMQTVIFAPLVQAHLEKGLEATLDHEQQRYSNL
ncbi:hypothetical protein DYB32_008590 [Aphanomyces invadans]|uniref:AB hydrolase-1 domain-containing protein n=1 Tax=Aphanomyces invadans TaxID=157072 RepID=A0A3R7CV87_9STRA|nr:hypothetical protein DYB32_008590 [Aphanomyces invadans]